MQQSFKTGLTTALGYLLTFLSIPIITRLYDPEEIGIFSLFGTMMMISIPLMSLCNDVGITNENERKVALKYCRITLRSAILHGLLLTVVFLCAKFIFGFPANLQVWMIVGITISASLGIFHSVGLSVAIYDRRDAQVRASSLVNQVSRPSLQILFGLFSGSVSSLVFAEIVGRLITVWTIKKQLLYDGIIDSLLKDKESAFKTRYAKWSLSKIAIDNLLLWSPPFFITIIFGPYAGGLAALTQRLGSAPISYFNFVVGTFFQRSLVFRELDGNYQIRSYIFRKFIYLFLIGFALFIFIALYGEFTVKFLFGNKWGDVVQVILLTLPMYTIQTCYVLIDRLLIFKNRLKHLLLINIALLTILLIVLGYAALSNINFFDTIMLLSLFLTLGYALAGIYSILKLTEDDIKVNFNE